MDKIFDHILDNLVLADVWEEIIKRILDALKEGADFWILLFVQFLWFWLGQSQAPFLSDIDLRHSGKAEQTEEIRRAILDNIPFSEYFRW